ELNAAVDQARLLRSVRELVAIGARMGGTPSGDAAAKYHEKRFADAGLAALLATDPELDAFQTLELAASVASGDATPDFALVDGCLALHTPALAPCELELR